MKDINSIKENMTHLKRWGEEPQGKTLGHRKTKTLLSHGATYLHLT